MKIEKLNDGLWIPSTDAQIEQWRQKGNPYMQETCLNAFKEWCDTQNKKFNLIVDIGAWCGTWTLSMQQYAKNIYCYEPNKVHFECLTRNLSMHENVRLYNQALGNEDGFVKLTEETATQNTRVLLEKGETKIDKLDSLNLQGVDFIKIDVEGLEMEVLKGAEKTLQNVKFGLKTVENPYQNTTYSGAGVRTFSFNFKMIAEKPDDALEIKKIHEFFR